MNKKIINIENKKRKKRVAKPKGMYYNGKAVKKKPDKREVNRKRNEKSEKRS